MSLRPRSSNRVYLLLPLLLVLVACSASTLAPTLTRQASLPEIPASPTAAPILPTDTPAPTLTEAVPTTALTPTNTSQASCPTSDAAEIDPAAILEMGPGPGLPATTAVGERLVIVGTVYTEGCIPLAGATLNLWQTDANGEYGPGHGTNDMRCCFLMGSLRTDAKGRYQFITVKPSHYEGEQVPPPAHIHVEISHPQAGQMMTEIVFTGDPYLPKFLQGYIVVDLESVTGSDAASTYLHGVADIVLE